jgi:hypothetical protein
VEYDFLIGARAPHHLHVGNATFQEVNSVGLGLQVLPATGAQIVQHTHLPAVGKQLIYQMGADEPHTSRN